MISASLDSKSVREFKKALKDYQKATGLAIEEGVVEMSRSAAKRLASTVPPFGLSSAIGKKFMESLSNQVDYAWQGSKRDVYPSSSMEAAHQAARNSRGTVPMRKFRRKKITNENISVAAKEIYKRKVLKKAGMAKAAYIAAGEMTIVKGGKNGKISGIPKWIREDVKSSLADSKTKRNGMSTEVALTNKVNYISKLHKSSQVDKALKQGRANAVKRMQKIIEKTSRAI